MTTGIAKVELSGPFFTKDPSKTLLENVQAMLEAVSREGETMARSLTPVRTGFTQSGIVGRVQSMTGKKWLMTSIISQQHVFPWAGHGARGFSGRGEAAYRGGKLEAKLHMFRQTAQALRSSRAVREANLAKGLE